MFNFFSGNYFYISVVLQVICVIHCIRRGRNNSWIWLIVFVPFVGCIAYIFTEMFSGNEIRNVQSGLGSIFNSAGSIRSLEENLRFSDTFNNRVALADAYLASAQTTKAIELYESSLTGAFEENEHVLIQLVTAYSKEKRYDDAISVAKKIYRLPQFARSQTHILYAIALGKADQPGQAEKEFKLMMGRFSNFEARYQYGLFLISHDRADEARQLYAEIIDEASHLSSRERNYNRRWFNLVKDEMRKMKT